MSSSISAPESYVKEAFRFCWDTLGNFLRVSEVFPAAYDQAQDAYKNETVFYTIRSDKDSHFTGAIVVNAKEDENLTGLASNKTRIKRVKVQADVNHGMNIIVWKKDTFDETDLDLDSFCGVTEFLSTDNFRIGGANQYYYDSGALDIPYEDLDGTFELHVSVMITVTDKVAGANDEIIVEVEYEPAA